MPAARGGASDRRSGKAETHTTIPPQRSGDLAIEILALSEAELIDRVVDLTIERDSYRRMVQMLLWHAHETESVRRANRRLAQTCRDLRRQIDALTPRRAA
jgi:hypothetical protein